ncbi:MAG: hypothetical protein AAFY60_12175, partial [Myxococcota bacterium]
MRKTLTFVFLTLGVLLLAITAGGRDIAWRLMIDEPKVQKAPIALARSREGLRGASLARISENPVQPKELLAAGIFSFVSQDGGESWRPIGDPHDLRSNYPTLHWTDAGALEHSAGEELWRSVDLGKTWQSVGAAELTLMPSTPVHSERFEGLPFAGTAMKHSDGSQWVATLAGAFVRRPENGEWQEKNAGINAPSIVGTALSGDGNVLAVDEAGRAWQSNDFGERWNLLRAHDVSRVMFLSLEGTPHPVLIHDGLKTTLVTHNSHQDISPSLDLLPPQPEYPAELTYEVCAARANEQNALEFLVSTFCSIERSTFPHQHGHSDHLSKHGRILTRSSDGTWSSRPYETSFFDGPRGSKDCARWSDGSVLSIAL